VLLDKEINEHSTKYDRAFLQLKKDYFSKIPQDKKVDKIKNKLQNIDS
jgi:hypothetical protein